MRISDWSSDVCSSDLAHDRQAHLLRHALGVELLLLDRGVGRPAAHGEVVAGDDDRAAVDGAAADDAVGRRQADQLAVLVIGGTAGDGADLAETAGVDQKIGRAHVELQSLMRISYAVFCLKKKNNLV